MKIDEVNGKEKGERYIFLFKESSKIYTAI
jgi:hypothetical protein